MERAFRIIFFLFVLQGCFLTIFAQTRISGNYTNASFEQFVKAVESSTDYRFFYNRMWTDSLAITVSVQDKLINTLLDSVFTGTDLHYNITSENIVYITSGRPILTELPSGFFGIESSSPAVTIDFDYSEYERKERLKKSVESKLYFIGSKTNDLSGNAAATGQVRNEATGEPVIGASVFVENPTIGVATDPFGNYRIVLPKGRHELKVKSIGMKSTQRRIMLYADGKLDIEMTEDVTPLKEVVVESERDINISSLQMGVEKLDIKTMRQMPLALGETDILKVVLTLPGVQSVGEGTSGINVRGGATSQNLILFNDATVYNPAHLFGFFSTFNPDVLKDVELYKSGITADFGGRLSAVLDVTSREGNLKKFSGAGGISPITGRLTLEGPIIKDRTSLLVAGRSTYSDWLLGKLNSRELQNSEASFYDFNVNLTHKVSDQSQVYLSAYLSKDRFKLNSDTLYSYSDRNASIKWKYGFNKKLFAVFNGGISEYKYSISSSKNPVNAFTMNFSVRQVNAKADFSYFLNTRHTVTAGLSTIRYDLFPGSRKPKGEGSIVTPKTLQEEHGQESALYFGDNFEISPKLSLYVGLRYSMYQYLGPKDVYVYPDGLSREESSIQDTIHYSSNTTIASYHGAEPRASLRYALSKSASVKFSYNRMRQYIQMLSNTTAIAPTDTWKLSDRYINPQVGDQFSLGLYKNLRGGLIEASLEAYYKIMENSLDYKNSAVLLLNHHIETDVLNAHGKAYGAELMLKKPNGKLNGWISYTYSRSLLQAKSENVSETINRGKYYPSSYDKPHAVNFISNYKINRRFNFSWNMTYSTGRPITLPLAKYDLGGSPRLHYGERNQHRIPDYFRMDLSINVEGNHRIKKLAHSSWTFAVYNLTGRENAYSVYFVSDGDKITGYKLSVFARPIPTITYNFKF